MKFAKILLPLDLEWTSLPAVHEAAIVARHFHAQILILSVVRHSTFLKIELGNIDDLMESARREQKQVEHSIAAELKDIHVEHLLLMGDPARTILETTVNEKIDLIVVGPHMRQGPSRLLGSVTHQILNAAEVPIWSSSDLEKPAPSLHIRKIVCGVDFTAHDRAVVEGAAAAAAEFKAKLVLAHATPDVHMYGPGGFYSPLELTENLGKAATGRIHKLIEDTGVHGEVFVASGQVHAVLNQAASELGADLLVIGRRPAAGMLGGNAYKIVSHARVPVLSV